MDMETFSSVGCGRIPLDEVQADNRVQIEGDQHLGQKVLEQMNIMVEVLGMISSSAGRKKPERGQGMEEPEPTLQGIHRDLYLPKVAPPDQLCFVAGLFLF